MGIAIGTEITERQVLQPHTPNAFIWMMTTGDIRECILHSKTKVILPYQECANLKFLSQPCIKMKLSHFGCSLEAEDLSLLWRSTSDGSDPWWLFSSSCIWRHLDGCATSLYSGSVASKVNSSIASGTPISSPVFLSGSELWTHNGDLSKDWLFCHYSVILCVGEVNYQPPFIVTWMGLRGHPCSISLYK